MSRAAIAMDRTRAAARHLALALGGILVACSQAPTPALAAFELRDVSPASLGAASTDGARIPALDLPARMGGWRVGGSRATIFGADGLAMNQLDAAVLGGSHSIRLAWTALSGADARESAARVEISETGERSASTVSLGACAERLDFLYDGFPGWGGFTLGGFARASAGPEGRRIGAWFRGDRLLRSASLERAGVAPSFEIGASLLAGGSTLAMLDRWERDASHSPRIALELPLGEAARIRFARGAAPGRVGAALTVRLGTLEVAWGRLDYAFGGTIAAVRVGLVGSKAAPPAPAPSRAIGFATGERPAPTRYADRATLLAPNPSAIMRPRAAIAPIDETEGTPNRSGASSDSSGASPSLDAEWLPAPEDDLESLESLSEAPLSGGEILLRGGLSEGRFRIRRVAAIGRGRPARWEVGFLEEKGRWHPGAVVALGPGAGRVVASAGRVSVAQTPALFTESMRWTRTVSRVVAPRAGAPSVAPSRGASPASLDGVAMIAGLNERRSPRSWVLAGRRSDGGGSVAALGLGIARGGARYSFALGALAPNDDATNGAALSATQVSGSMTVVRRVAGSETSVEALAARDRRGALVALERRSGRAVFSARWRYRSWAARKVAGELIASTFGSGSRARLLWRTWADDAPADDGLLEAEAVATRRGKDPAIRIRVGARGLADAGVDAASRERYAVTEVAVARDRSRSLSLRASRREFSGRNSRSSGQTIGARLDAGGGMIGDHTILIEATRLRRGASAAWGSGLSASGTETLRTRSKAGLWLAARGTVGARRWRIGYALERVDEPGGARPWSGVIWLRLGRLQ